MSSSSSSSVQKPKRFVAFDIESAGRSFDGSTVSIGVVVGDGVTLDDPNRIEKKIQSASSMASRRRLGGFRTRLLRGFLDGIA